MFEDIDLLIAGAGPVGCVIAERAATQMGWKVLIVERRDHIAGNCYDRFHESGILIQQYGPHYFRTDNTSLINYLSSFTEWTPGNYIVKSQVKGRLFPFPINLTTLEMFFGRTFTPEEAKAFLEKTRVPIENPANSEEFILSRVGRELYEAFYLGYTRKQWSLSPRDLAPSVCGRVPIRLNRDERYVDQKFQLTPKHGFTALFSKMIAHPNIHLLLKTVFREVARAVKPRHGTVYCGPIDEYFDYQAGILPWRSLRFDFKELPIERAQPCVQVNYPDENAYTRTVEFKHVTGQKHPHTVVSYEYPTAEGDPYYPVPNPLNDSRYRKYETLAAQETIKHRVYFCGRLANYTYINSDQAIERALLLFEDLRRKAVTPAASGG